MTGKEFIEMCRLTNYEYEVLNGRAGFVDHSRCRKCVYELHCSRDKDIDGKCQDYKRDAPDGGYYG